MYEEPALFCPRCNGTGKVRARLRKEPDKYVVLICRACLGKGLYDEELLRRMDEWDRRRKEARDMIFSEVKKRMRCINEF